MRKSGRRGRVDIGVDDDGTSIKCGFTKVEASRGAGADRKFAYLSLLSNALAVLAVCLCGRVGEEDEWILELMMMVRVANVDPRRRRVAHVLVLVESSHT